jgi:prevent-host-death family protein
MAAEDIDDGGGVVEPSGEDSAARGARGESGETIDASDARAYLSRLLAEVERGRIITISRRGVPVAVLAPPETIRLAGSAADDEEGVRQAIDAWRGFRDSQPESGATVAEILAWVKEGRR